MICSFFHIYSRISNLVLIYDIRKSQFENIKKKNKTSSNERIRTKIPHGVLPRVNLGLWLYEPC